MDNIIYVNIYMYITEQVMEKVQSLMLCYAIKFYQVV